MTDREREVAAKRSFRLWYSLVAVIGAQLVMMAVMFVVVLNSATRQAEMQQSRTMCPLVAIYVQAYSDPTTPQPTAPVAIRIRDAMRALYVALHCTDLQPVGVSPSDHRTT